jgi:Fe-S oxidoreductase
MEEQEGKERVNNKRALQLVDTGAETIASGCPFCAYMIGDGLKNAEKGGDVTQLDVGVMLLIWGAPAAPGA